MQGLIMSDNWNDRIKNSEVNPPADAWERIAASLDESLDGLKFPRALYNLETSPPAGAWNNIETALDEQAAPVIPIKKHFAIPAFLKYAIAACLIAVLSFAVIKFFNGDTIKADTAVGETNNGKPADTTKKTEQTPTIKVQPAPFSRDENEQSSEQSSHTYAKADVSKNVYYSRMKKSLYKAPVQLASSYSTSLLQMPELQYSHRAAVNDSPDKETDRYLMFKNTDGQFIRISKKLSTLFCCVSGEEQDNNCTDQLKKWKEKLASSSFIPSPDNFMDILDLVNSLEDNHN